MRKAAMLFLALLLVACAKEDPAAQRETLKHSIERLDAAIARYKEQGIDGVEDLQKMKKAFEEELQDLDD